jgi:hypothetical protein
MTRQALFAVAAAVLLVGVPLTGAVAAADSAGNAAGNLSVGVTQDGGEVTVAVERNDTGVANASVAVESVDNTSYAGAGDYTADEGGEVTLPAPVENVTVTVTAEADNETATATVDLVAGTGDGAFGERVSSYVQALLQDSGGSLALGPQVAAYVTANNPGNAPDNAGPPAFLADEDSERGDDASAENETDDRRGPPAERGPPADAGPPEDRGDEDSAEEEDSDDSDEEEGTETEEADDDEDEDEDGERGPPAGAGPPGDR